MTQEKNFWSRRRAAVQEEEQLALAATQAQDLDQQRADLETREDSEILAELGLPDPDALTLDDDISGFMNKVVPDRLRRRALRKLWRLNPVLANVDGLVDYGEDYTDAATVVENLQTTYQVGKGMLAHVQEMARQAEADAAAHEETAAEDIVAENTATENSEQIASDPVNVSDNSDGGVVQTAESDLAVASDAPQAMQATAPEQTQQEQSDTLYAAVRPRRMRFEFEG